MDAPPGARPGPRRRSQIDWELMACGWSGHTLVGTDAEQVREQDGHLVREAAAASPVRWHRCLRCDTWVGLEPPAAPTVPTPPSRDEINVPRRGKALRDTVVLRLIAIDRAVHFLILGLLGLAVLVIANHRGVHGSFYRVLSAIQNAVGGGPVQQHGKVGIFHELDKLFTLSAGRLHLVGAVLLGYAVLEGVEAVGLWLVRRWAEYLTFVATTILLVPEVYELTHKLTVLKVLGFVINLAVVVYLLYAKRLFGLRGGGRVDEEERAQALSWETLEHATPPWHESRLTAPREG